MATNVGSVISKPLDPEWLGNGDLVLGKGIISVTD